MLNKLILGTVQLGVNYGINNLEGKPSLDKSFNILNIAFENGIKTLDTAEAYGSAHEVIGLFHSKNPTKKFKVITKFPKLINYDIVDKVDSYLKDLKINHLETLMFHSFDSYQNNINNLDILKNLKSNNKINTFGVSVYTNDEIEKVILNQDIDIIQLPFNLLDNINYRGDILHKAKIKGKIIHTRSSFLQGLFFKDFNNKMHIVKKLKKQLEILKQIRMESNCSVEELALGYCVGQNNIDNVIIGIDSTFQLINNIKASNFHITENILKKINNINVKDLNLLNPSLWNQILS